MLEQVGVGPPDVIGRRAQTRAALNELATEDWKRQVESEKEKKQ